MEKEKLDKMIDHMISEKMDYKEYMEIAREMQDEELKRMFEFIANQEHDHFRMLKEYIANHMN